jgi:hypothetical protein
MPSLPPLDIKTNTNHAPHIVVLGAGASLAAFPNGERRGRILPLMRNLVEITGLAPVLQEHGIATPIEDFEAFYDDLATRGTNLTLVLKIEEAVRSYFASLELPDEATLYDYLLLSLREKDLIATFNWDPFLAQAYRRNAQIRKLPQIAFLHGNVAIGACHNHKSKGFAFQTCSECAKPLTPTRLLYPVRHKDYDADAFIRNEWDTLRSFLKRAYMVTIFGYSAPITDMAARKLMLDEWRNNPTVELAEISIVDIRARADLEAAWRDFFVRQQYGIYNDVLDTYQFRHPRRSCDAFAMARLQQQPWHENPFPRLKDLSRLHEWIKPLRDEEDEGMLTGKQCQ